MGAESICFFVCLFPSDSNTMHSTIRLSSTPGIIDKLQAHNKAPAPTLRHKIPLRAPFGGLTKDEHIQMAVQKGLKLAHATGNEAMNPGIGPLKGNHQLDGSSWGHSLSRLLSAPLLNHFWWFTRKTH